ncbi:hypothetical protein ACE6H2_026812 [Prunus campanulata]
MALRMNLLSPKIPKQSTKFHTNSFPSLTHFNPRPKTQIIIHCNNKNISDAELASDLTKMNTLFMQREEAMKKSRELLFTELCHYLNSKSEEVKKKWRKMEEEDKWVLVKGFVSEWGVNFHPLSAKSVKELVEEHLHEENPPAKSSAAAFFPGLKRMMGFSEDN